MALKRKLLERIEEDVEAAAEEVYYLREELMSTEDEEDREYLREELMAAENHLAEMDIANECDHPRKALKIDPPQHGMTLWLLDCTKCGYTWVSVNKMDLI